jgi:predicted nucleic acid-binding protein
LVDVLLNRRLRLSLDDRIELEYRGVLARPRLGIERGRREAFLAILRFQEHVNAPPWPHRAPPDGDDVMFLEVALQTSARTVVTGNLKHSPPVCRGPATVISPRSAWEWFVGLGLT